jgi:hypothetical protein
MVNRKPDSQSDEQTTPRSHLVRLDFSLPLGYENVTKMNGDVAG